MSGTFGSSNSNGIRIQCPSPLDAMTIRRQLTLSYLGILLLLGCNMLTYLWTDVKREAAFEDLRRAISRQTLIDSVQQQLGDYQKQVTLLSQITGEGGLSAPSREET